MVELRPQHTPPLAEVIPPGLIAPHPAHLLTSAHIISRDVTSRHCQLSHVATLHRTSFYLGSVHQREQSTTTFFESLLFISKQHSFGLPEGEGTHGTNQGQSCNSNWVPIVSHSPGPEGDSCGNLPPDQGEIAPDRQTNPYPPPPWGAVMGGGGANKGGNCPQASVVGVGGGGHMPAWSPEPPGPAQPKLVGVTQPATGTHHAVHPKNLSRTPSSPSNPPPRGGRAGGQKTA